MTYPSLALLIFGFLPRGLEKAREREEKRRLKADFEVATDYMGDDAAKLRQLQAMLEAERGRTQELVATVEALRTARAARACVRANGRDSTG